VKMIIQKTRKRDRQSSHVKASKANNTLLISSKLLADLKNYGIMAFRQMSDDEQKVVWKWSKEVIRQYQRALEADPSNIRNIESLPFPKEDIKLAIKLSLPFYISKNVQSMVKVLKTAYREIGVFQNIDSADEGKLFFTTYRKKASSYKNDQDNFRIYEKYMSAIVSEKKALVQEINDFVTDLEAVK
jgi:hypothetical protein